MLVNALRAAEVVRGRRGGGRQEAAPDGPGGTSCVVNIVRIVLAAITHARSLELRSQRGLGGGFTSADINCIEGF